MNTLIENTVKILGLGHPDMKTIFDITNENDKKDNKYISLEKLKNANVYITYQYNNGTSIEKSSISLKLPSLTEQQIKDYIVAQINNELTNK